ncbi:MAG: cytochrome P460 family protein [Gammaproteobacteria bacterium]|nr:cytochrome P460 family protein [Gammaproteobacteria bacterium]
MKHGKILISVAGGLLAAFAFAGGRPDYVAFPTGYEASFTNYATMNRAGSAAVAKVYANDVAVASYRDGNRAAPGSVIVMEVHKPQKDADGNPIVGSDGVNKIAKLAAIAVMERREAWPVGFPDSERPGNWGFAIYNPDGSIKQNDLACVSCHTPLEAQDYMFSHQRLKDYVSM